MIKATPTRLLLGIGVLVFLWNGWRGYDLVPDFLQSRSELLCQICEGRAFKGATIKPGYRRLTCEKYVEQESTLAELWEWQGLEDSDSDPLLALGATLPPNGYVRKRTVETSYILDEAMPTERLIKATCEVFVAGGTMVQSANGNFTEYSFVKTEKDGKTP